MGWGPNNYSVPLSPTGEAPVTHYGLHAWAEQSFVDLMEGASAGVIPQVEGLTKTKVVEVLQALVTSIRTTSDGHWASVLDTEGLKSQV